MSKTGDLTEEQMKRLSDAAPVEIEDDQYVDLSPNKPNQNPNHNQQPNSQTNRRVLKLSPELTGLFFYSQVVGLKAASCQPLYWS